MQTDPSGLGAAEAIMPPIASSDAAASHILPSSMSLSVSTNLDGTVDVEYGPAEAAASPARDLMQGHNENLAETVEEAWLNAMGVQLCDMIGQDDNSRAAWLDNTVKGIKHLGLQLEEPDPTSPSGISTVRHPLLLEAVLRFQANASGELLPVDGPVKVRNDSLTPPPGLMSSTAMTPPAPGMPPPPSPPATVSPDDLAEALEKDFNHYLTVTATEYYPETEKMLFWTGFSGSGFKKIYHCPLRRRPVSEMVSANDLIVSNEATEIMSAGRVTQKIRMRPSVLKRMQIAGAYRETDVSTPSTQGLDAVDLAVREIDGREAIETTYEEDREHELMECYCELDVPGHEHEEDGEMTGLPLPYKVTIERESMRVLELRRNWKEGDEDCRQKRTFVQYPFVPGIGFYNLGLLNLLVNQNAALTGAWRIALDAGMLANFPGGLVDQAAIRQDKISLAGGVGEFVGVKVTGNKTLKESVFPYPYKTPDAGFMNLVAAMADEAKGLAGTAEMNTGEGKQDAPVGTTIALIEQATKVMNAVHRRLHRAQALEFSVMIELFRENPTALYKGNDNPKVTWDDALVLQALQSFSLVPVSDPNTASTMQRIMKAQAVGQLAQQAPEYFEVDKVIERIMREIGMSNYQELLSPPEKVAAKQAAMAAAAAKGKGGAPTGQPMTPDKMIAAQARMLDAQTKARGLEQEAQTAMVDAHVKMSEISQKTSDNQRSIADQAADRQQAAQLAAFNFHKDMVLHHDKHDRADRQHGLGLAAAAAEAHLSRMHDVDQAHRERKHGIMSQALGAQHAIDLEKARPKPAARA